MISVITPVYRRYETLFEAVDSVDLQTHGDWQHVIVSDGPDPLLRESLAARGYKGHGKRVFAELGRNWHGFMGGDDAPNLPGHPGSRGGRGSRGAMAAYAATMLAAGDRIAYLDSDCAYLPGHLKTVSALLDHPSGPDFAYTQMLRVIDGRIHDVIGDGEPAHGKIDGNSVAHRAELLKTANWRWGGDSDWDLFSRWLNAGAAYRFSPSVTVKWHQDSEDVF